MVNESLFTMGIKPVTSPKRGRKQLRSPNPAVTARVMDAAAALIREGGFPLLRVEEVAARAGVSVGTFYLYFEGKDDLFVQLVVEYTNRLRASLAAAYAVDGPFADRMQRALDAYLDFVEANEAGFLYFRDSGTVDTTVGRLSTWAASQHAEDLQPILEQAMAKGEIRRDDTVLLAQATVGLVQHLAGFWLEHRHHCSRGELQRFVNQLLMFGSTARSPAPGET
jgi:AcrR family transcriptional regulator